MNYKKEILDNYTLHLINTDKFKDINVSIRFTKTFDKEDYAYLKLLEKVLRFNSTKKYKDITLISKELERLYNSNIMFKTYTESKNMIFEIGVSFVNPKYTENSIYDSVFNLLEEILYNQNIKDNEFNRELFSNQKNNLIKSILNVKDINRDYGNLLFEEIFYKNTVYAENNLKNIKVFEELTNDKLYKVYTSLFDSFKVDVLVLGDYSMTIKDNIGKCLKNIKSVDNVCKNLYIDIKKDKEVFNKECVNASQSNLFIGLTLDNLTELERDYKLIVYNTILGCMNNSILFVNVREKNSLCYHIGSIINKYTTTLIIEAGISGKNYEQAYQLIKESLESMKDEKVIAPLIKNAKKTLELAYNDFYDNKYKIINYYYMNEISYTPSIESRRKMLNDITISDIINIANKVNIKDIFLLEGVNNEEN